MQGQPMPGQMTQGVGAFGQAGQPAPSDVTARIAQAMMTPPDRAPLSTGSLGGGGALPQGGTLGASSGGLLSTGSLPATSLPEGSGSASSSSGMAGAGMGGQTMPAAVGGITPPVPGSTGPLNGGEAGGAAFGSQIAQAMTGQPVAGQPMGGGGAAQGVMPAPSDPGEMKRRMMMKQFGSGA